MKKQNDLYTANKNILQKTAGGFLSANELIR